MMLQALRDELNLIVALWVAEDPKVVEARESYYGWEDYIRTKHLKGQRAYKDSEAVAPCELILPEKPEYEEDYIGEFAGTFNEGSSELMLTVGGASCACGKYKDFKIRREGSTSLILAELMNKPIPSRY